LKELRLNSNRLEEINSNVKYLKSLEKLKLDRNSISEISNDLYDLEYLNYLDLDYNKIIRLSQHITKCKSLKVAHSYTKLDKLGLWLIGNPLKIPPLDYWSTVRIEKIYDFLANYNQRNLDYYYYAKLVFMGQPGIGKSSLIDSFYHMVEKDESSSLSLLKISSNNQILKPIKIKKF